MFDSFVMAENAVSGFTFLKANSTKELTTLSNSMLIGRLILNFDEDSDKYKGSAIITPRTGDVRLFQIHFQAYGANQTVLSTCANCDELLFLVTTAQSVFTAALQFINVGGNYLSMHGIKRDHLR